MILRSFLLKATSHSTRLVVFFNKLGSEDFSPWVPFPVIWFQSNFRWMYSWSDIFRVVNGCFVTWKEIETLLLFLLLFLATTFALFSPRFVTIYWTWITTRCRTIWIWKAESRLTTRARAVSKTWGGTGLSFRLVWLQGLFWHIQGHRWSYFDDLDFFNLLTDLEPEI